MTAWQQVLLLAVLAAYAAGQSPQSTDPATLHVTFIINISVTSCQASPAEMKAMSENIANVVAARASRPHHKYPVNVDVSTCTSSSGGQLSAKFTRAVQVSYRGSWKARNFILDSLRRQGPCRTFPGICRILNGTNGSGCILDALDPSNMCGTTPPPGTCSPPCVNGRCEGSKCVCTAGYFGLQCQRFYGTDKLTFQIPRVLTGTAPPDDRNTAKLLVKASRGWPLVCILQANLLQLNDTLYKPAAGDSMIHPVHACPHLLTSKSRTAFLSGSLLANPGNASQQLDLHQSIDTTTGKLKWAATFSEDFSFLNSSSGPLATEPPPDDKAYMPGDTVLRYNDTVFFDRLLIGLATMTAPADAGTFAAFAALDSYLRSPSSRRASSGSDDQQQQLKALASLTQTLTAQLAAKHARGLLVHLTRLDDNHAAVEAELSKRRGESCDMAAFSVYMARNRPEISTAELWRLSNLQECFCDASTEVMSACLAYADVVANQTANAFQETSNGTATSRKGSTASVQSASLPMASMDEGQASQANHNRRRALAAAASVPATRTDAVLTVAANTHDAASEEGIAAASQSEALELWSAREGNESQLKEPTVQLSNSLDMLSPLLYQTPAAGGRQLQHVGPAGVSCNWHKGSPNKKGKEMSGWLTFLASNAINWVVLSPSITFQCCIPVPCTGNVFVGCIGLSVGSFNFQFLNADLTMTPSISLNTTLGLSEVYCKSFQDCQGTCGDAVQEVKPESKRPDGDKYVCPVDKGGAILDQLNFNFYAGFTIDFCFDVQAGKGIFDTTDNILNLIGLSPCLAGLWVSAYPLRGWDFTLTVYFQVLVFRVSVTWDLATQQDTEQCEHFCHCYPGSKLFADTSYCRMCTNKQNAIMGIDINLRVLFFKLTIFTNVGSLTTLKPGACPAKLRKLSAVSDLRRHDLSVLNDLFRKLLESGTNRVMFADAQLAGPADALAQLGGVPMSCSGCTATDSCLISRNANQTVTSCVTLSKEDVHVWLKLSVQDCLSGDCQNCTQQTGDVASSCAKCSQCISCAPGMTAGNSGVSSYCGNNGTANEFNDWHTVQDWIDDLVVDSADAPCPCKGTESCMKVSPALLDSNGNTLSDGVCVNLTPPQTLDLVGKSYWPGLNAGHTHLVGCSSFPTGPLTKKQPQKHSWHGPSSFCAWRTGALAFVDGADDPYQPVGMPCGPRKGALTSDAATEANLCPPVPGLVCAWDNTCSFAPKHRWTSFGCQQAYTSNSGACINTAFNSSTGLPIDQADCSIYHGSFQWPPTSGRGTPPPSWSTNSSCDGQAGVLRPAEFLEARNRDGMAWRMVLQGDGRLVVYFIHFHDFFGNHGNTLLQEATALRPAAGRKVMFSFPDINSDKWKARSYLGHGASPYTLRLAHDGLSMSSAAPGSNPVWYISWSSIGAERFDTAFPVSIRGTDITIYNGWFSVCGLPASHAGCTLDGQVPVAGQQACSSLEKCYRWIKLSGP